MRILFVGQAPSRETDGLPPFVGKCGTFLAELLGTTQEQMLFDHDFVNVLDRWPGRGPGGDKFPMLEAKVAAKKKIPQLRGRTVVLLGANVARAFGGPKFQYLGWYQLRNPDNLSDIICQATIVPHPSGVNRHWNNHDNRLIAAKFLRTLASRREEK